MPTATLERPVREVSLPYFMTDLTDAIHQHAARFRVLCCGRRFGKSWFGLFELYRLMHQARALGQDQVRALVIAPTYPMVEEDWLIAKQLFAPLIRQKDETDKVLHLDIGRMDFKSADAQGGAARGAGYDAALFDEAARIPEDVWEADVRPSLADRRGRAIFISTPVGLNWFYRLYLLGQENPDYHSWRYSTHDGWQARFGHLPDRMQEMDKEWADLQHTTSQRKFQREYLAQFLEAEGQLWDIEGCIRGQLRPAQSGESFVAGLDVAHVEDWMVTLILEQHSKQVVALHRSRHRSWNLQKAEALFLLKQYPRVRVLIDSTGLGDPIAQDLREAGVDVEDVVFTMRRKEDMVENLSVALDHSYLGLPNQPETEWLLGELKTYQEWKTPSGNIKYGAPSGMHDDGVTALMLAAWGLRFNLKPEIDARLSRPAQDEFTSQQLIDFTHRADAWRRIYPNKPVPHHPHSLSWMWNRDWVKGLL